MLITHQLAFELQADIKRLAAEITRLETEKEKVEKKAKDGKSRILSCPGTEELPKQKKEAADKGRQIAALQKQFSKMRERYGHLKANSLHEYNSHQKEIDAATKRVAEWEARYKTERNRTKELHRLAYPEDIQNINARIAMAIIEIIKRNHTFNFFGRS